MKMVDRSYPPTDAEVATLRANGVDAIAVYIGGANNGGRAWQPSHAGQMRRAFNGLVLPIYVGQNSCDGCVKPVVLTAAQGEDDGQDAVNCARAYGFPSGPLCLDVEYDTYMGNVAGSLAYMEAWARAVRDEGYLPVLYAVIQTARDYQPRPGEPVGLWIANWDKVGDLSKFPNASRFSGIGWQYDGSQSFDYSNVDGAWWQTLAPAPPPQPADDRILVDANPFGAFGYRLGFKGRLQQIGAAVSPKDVNAGILAWIGWAKEDEWVAADGNTYQRTERGVLQFTPNTAPPFDIVIRPTGAGALPGRKP